jgi:hypothetical protein
MNDYIPLADRDPAEATRRDQQYRQDNPLVDAIEQEMAEQQAVNVFKARKEAAARLTKATMDSVTKTFANYTNEDGTPRPHRPSKRMFKALTCQANFLSKMAAGIAPKRHALASADPGVGKTQTLAHWIKALLEIEDPILSTASVIICVSKLEEIWIKEPRLDKFGKPIPGEFTERGLIVDIFGATTEEREPWRRRFAVLVGESEHERNSLGRPARDKAQILFVSQRQLYDRMMKVGNAFEPITEFHYYGQPRRVRVHDEGLLPAHPVLLDARAILDLQGGLEHALRRRKVLPEDADVSGAEAKLFDIGSQLKRWQEDGAMFVLPDLEEHFGLTLNDARRLLFNNSDLQELASLYYGVAGKAGIVRINYQSNRQFLSYTEGLAEDLAPMLILDASGRVRNTYKAWRERWKTLLILPSAPKSYRTVEINLANLPAGKTLFTERKKERTIQLRASILKADAALIAEHPEARWLVYTFKGLDYVDQLRQLLPDRPDGTPIDLKGITWGRHTAVNHLADRTHLLVSSFLFYSPEEYEARTRVANRLPRDDAGVDRDLLNWIEEGEHADNLLQGLPRGCMRLSDGDTCPRCRVWIRLPAARGLDAKLLRKCFPDCTVRPWYPLGQRAKTAKERMFEFIVAAIKPQLLEEPLEDGVEVPQVGPDGVLLTEPVRVYAGVNDKANFRKMRDSLELDLDAKGIEFAYDGRGTRIIGWKAKPCPFTIER